MLFPSGPTSLLERGITERNAAAEAVPSLVERHIHKVTTSQGPLTWTLQGHSEAFMLRIDQDILNVIWECAWLAFLRVRTASLAD